MTSGKTSGNVQCFYCDTTQLRNGTIQLWKTDRHYSH